MLLAAAEPLCMSLWFSASAVVPALQSEWRLTESGASWLALSELEAQPLIVAKPQ